MNTIQENSSGGVLFCYLDNLLQIYLILNADSGYVFPKGGIDRGESEEEAAIREVREESGYEVRSPIVYIDTVVYSYKRKGVPYQKSVKYFAFELKHDAMIHPLILDKYENIIGGEWFDYEIALSKLYFESDKEILKKFKIIFDKDII